MAKANYQTPEDYLGAQSPEAQQVLRQVQAAIRKGAPKADEVISYSIPAFRNADGWILYYSIYTKHFSLSCPPPFAAFTAFKDELAHYKQSKSAVQFPLDEPVPAKLITAMARHQVKANAEAAAAKPVAKKPAAKRK